MFESIVKECKGKFKGYKRDRERNKKKLSENNFWWFQGLY
jgi:hypothetical protein